MNSLMPSKERSFASRLFAIYSKTCLLDSVSGKVVSLNVCSETAERNLKWGEGLTNIIFKVMFTEACAERASL